MRSDEHAKAEASRRGGTAVFTLVEIRCLTINRVSWAVGPGSDYLGNPKRKRENPIEALPARLTGFPISFDIPQNEGLGACSSPEMLTHGTSVPEVATVPRDPWNNAYLICSPLRAQPLRDRVARCGWSGGGTGTAADARAAPLTRRRPLLRADRSSACWRCRSAGRHALLPSLRQSGST